MLSAVLFSSDKKACLAGVYMYFKGQVPSTQIMGGDKGSEFSSHGT